MKSKDKSLDDKSRRDFLSNLSKSFGLCTCAAIAGSLLSSCETFTELDSPSQGITKLIDISSPVDIPDANARKRLMAINNYGGGARIAFDDANYSIPVMLVRLNEDEIACFSTLCTHDNCYGENMTEPYNNTMEGLRVMICGCHGSKFDPYQDGKPIVGPAEKALKKFKTKFDKTTNILTIDF